jgi:hypothetical protein
VEKDQRIKENTLNYPSKRLRRHLWAVLDGYRWRRSRLVSRCRARLPIIFCPFGESNTLKRYTNFIYNLYLIQLSHIQNLFDILNKKFQIYILVTPIKFQHEFALWAPRFASPCNLIFPSSWSITNPHSQLRYALPNSMSRLLYLWPLSFVSFTN